MSGYNLGDFQRAVRDDRELFTEHEAIAALMLASHAGSDGLNAHPGTELLALEMKTGESTAYRALCGLRDKNVIQRTAKGNKRLGLSDTYRLMPPEAWNVITRLSDVPNTPLYPLVEEGNQASERCLKIGESTSGFSPPGQKAHTAQQGSTPASDLRSQAESKAMQLDLSPQAKIEKCGICGFKVVYFSEEDFHSKAKKHFSEAHVKAAPVRAVPMAKPSSRTVGVPRGKTWYQCENCSGEFEYLRKGGLCRKCDSDMNG